MISELGQGRYKMNLECFVRTINKKVVKTNTKKNFKKGVGEYVERTQKLPEGAPRGNRWNNLSKTIMGEGYVIRIEPPLSDDYSPY